MINNGSAVDNRESVNRNNRQNKEDEDGFGEFEFQSESLLSLVQPELPSLSQYWLAALRDHALLSLPPGNFWAIKNISVIVLDFFKMFMNSS